MTFSRDYTMKKAIRKTIEYLTWLAQLTLSDQFMKITQKTIVIFKEIELNYTMNSKDSPFLPE